MAAGAPGDDNAPPAEVETPEERPAAPGDSAPLQRILDDPDIAAVLGDLARNPEAARDHLATVDYGALRAAVEAVLPAIEGWIERLGPERFAKHARLDVVEAALLIQFGGMRRPRHRTLHAPPRDPLALPTLVAQLGLPADRIHGSMGTLFLKLVRILTRRR
jgi:hypothetical protein